MENYVKDYEDIPYELLNGQIVYMSPRPSTIHNKALSNIFSIFHYYLKGKNVFHFLMGLMCFWWNNNVIPDVTIVCNPDIVKNDGIYGAPDLIVEVLSPTTANNDKGYKKKVIW